MAAPPYSQKLAVNAESMYNVLRELVGLMAAARAEVRMLRIEVASNRKEDKMAMEDLVRNVTTLMDAAKAYKSASATSAAAHAQLQAEQPAIEDLNNQVLAALNEIGVVPPEPVVDPNAPVT